MFQLLYFLVHAISPILVPVCFFCAWMMTILVVWNISSAIAQGVSKTKRLHSIPCANCQYFTGDYRLKCTVKPSDALTEEAINCSDYCPVPGYSLHSPDSL
ncbi:MULTISPECIES: hypothetical protein [Cyanophyceae]|uniref:hypothetical protein n=1 Tax=Cyanophyceae TaxID=3028117 RepID=UPI001686E141|nr:hypothetical protein [Trichocoleus sp. FACHB-40]MBD2006870.1 hypothetical protein [Trichocoleus sp. FACHB-40]